MNNIITIKYQKRNTISRSLLTFIFIMICFFYFFKVFYNEGVKEQQIEQLLDDYGITTQAKIQKCACSTRGKTCDVTYKYETFINNSHISSIGIDVTSYDYVCKPSSIISIEYLPENPKLSRIEGNEYGSLYTRLYHGFSCIFTNFISLSLIISIFNLIVFYRNHSK